MWQGKTISKVFKGKLTRVEVAYMFTVHYVHKLTYDWKYLDFYSDWLIRTKRSEKWLENAFTCSAKTIENLGSFHIEKQLRVQHPFGRRRRQARGGAPFNPFQFAWPLYSKFRENSNFCKRLFGVCRMFPDIPVFLSTSRPGRGAWRRCSRSCSSPSGRPGWSSASRPHPSSPCGVTCELAQVVREAII